MTTRRKWTNKLLSSNIFKGKLSQLCDNRLENQLLSLTSLQLQESRLNCRILLSLLMGKNLPTTIGLQRCKLNLRLTKITSLPRLCKSVISKAEYLELLPFISTQDFALKQLTNSKLQRKSLMSSRKYLEILTEDSLRAKPTESYIKTRIPSPLSRLNSNALLLS